MPQQWFNQRLNKLLNHGMRSFSAEWSKTKNKELK